MPTPASRRSRNCFDVASSSVRVAIGQRLPRKHGEDDGDKVAERREDEKARIALGPLEITGDGEPDEEPDIHAGVVPEEGSFAARIFRGKALRQHHVDAGDVQAAAGEEEGEADVEHGASVPTAMQPQPMTCSAMPPTKRFRFERKRPPR